MSDPAPNWKFWHPLPFWHVLVIFFIAQLVATIFVVALREGLGLNWVSSAAAGGAGGFLGVVIVLARAKKARDAAQQAPPRVQPKTPDASG